MIHPGLCQPQRRSKNRISSLLLLCWVVLIHILLVSLTGGGTNTFPFDDRPGSSFVVMTVNAFAVPMDDNMNTNNNNNNSNNNSSVRTKECAVIGVGVLGTSLCRQLLESPDFQDWKITGITKTSNRHASILDQVGGDHNGRFILTTNDELLSLLDDDHADKHPKTTTTTTIQRFQYCVFCAPPSGFDDYPAAVRSAATDIWAGADAGGTFVFTSSGGIYGPGESTISTVNEDSPVPDPTGNPRSERLQGAESVVRDVGGTSLRLAGLYTLERGAHNFWLMGGKDQVGGRSDGIVNLLHYDDAAGSVVATLRVDPTVVHGKTFLISDGNPLTRQQICESSIQSAKYNGLKIPTFTGTKEDPIGKVYDGSATDRALNWKPRYPSFDNFMASSK